MTKLKKKTENKSEQSHTIHNTNIPPVPKGIPPVPNDINVPQITKGVTPVPKGVPPALLLGPDAHTATKSFTPTNEININAELIENKTKLNLVGIPDSKPLVNEKIVGESFHAAKFEEGLNTEESENPSKNSPLPKMDMMSELKMKMTNRTSGGFKFDNIENKPKADDKIFDFRAILKNKGGFPEKGFKKEDKEIDKKNRKSS